jgi:hypothetical protein
MMDHVPGQSKQQPPSDESAPRENDCEHPSDEPGSYYYDDSTNYEIFHDDESNDVTRDQD